MYRSHRISLFFLVFLGFLKSFGQPVLNSQLIDIKSNNYTETISVVDHQKNSHVFLFGANNIYHLKYNENFKLVHQQEHEIRIHSALEVKGYALNENGAINIYLGVLGFREITLFSFLPDNTLAEYTFEFEKEDKDEIEIASLKNNNQYYLLTIQKKSSLLRLYSFSDASYAIQPYDFSSDIFYSATEKPTTLFNLFKKKRIITIEENVPTSIEVSSSKFKLFKTDSTFIIAMNHRRSSTRLIHLNLKEPDKSTSASFNIPATAVGKLSSVKSNSFVFENRIYQIAANKENFLLQISDLGTKTLLQEFLFNEEDRIEFNNSPIYQGGGAIASELENIRETDDFLKRMTSKQIGITVYRKNEQLIITFGGLYNERSGGAPMMPGFGIPIASFGAVSVVINPTFWAYSAYSNTSSVFTRSLLDDTTLEHQRGFAPVNAFDLISIYKNQDLKDRKIRHETIFKTDNFFVFGYLDKKNKTYNLVQF